MMPSSEAEMNLFKDFKGLYVYVLHGAKGVCYVINCGQRFFEFAVLF